MYKPVITFFTVFGVLFHTVFANSVFEMLISGKYSVFSGIDYVCYSPTSSLIISLTSSAKTLSLFIRVTTLFFAEIMVA